MGVFSNIEIALNTRLATLSPLPVIAWQNMAFIPKENILFLRPTVMPVGSSLNQLNGVERHLGIYQVDVYVPLEKGVLVVNNLLDSIKSLFSSNKTLTATDTVFIQEVSLGRAQRQESWYVGFVEIHYLCYS